MKNLLFTVFLFTCCIASFAQESDDEFRRTIKVQKTGHLSKIIFDDVNYRLVGIDQYGNPLDSAVTEFRMGVTIKGIYYREETLGSVLSNKMQQLLGQCDQGSRIIFDKIKAKDQSGTLMEMPKFTYAIGGRNDDN